MIIVTIGRQRSSAGTCIVTATKAADINYNVATDATPTIAVNAIVPGAPTIGTGTPGDAQAMIGYTAPGSNGGSGITGYTATCTASGQTTRTGAGTTSPITVGTVPAPLVNGVTYACSVTATNVAGTGPASGTVNVTPSATPVAPTINSTIAATFVVLTAGTTFTVTATGTPTPTVALFSGTLPTGMTTTAGTGSRVISGTPASGTAVAGPTSNGIYPLVFRATNSAGSQNQSFTLTVDKLTQAMTFNPPTTQEFSPTPVPISPLATATLAPITYSTSESNCTVNSAAATFTTLALGDCNLIADQAGNNDYKPISSGMKNFTIVQGSQTITFGAQSAQTYSPSGVFAFSPRIAFAIARTVRRASGRSSMRT